MPDNVWWTATDPVAPTRATGAMRKQRGVKPGTADVLVFDHGRFIRIEMKSPGGRCSKAQRASREKMLAAGGVWWEAKSAHAAMWALAESGVKFREYVGLSGAVDRWHDPELAPWEVPRRDPSERRVWKWDVAERRRVAALRRRERQRAAAERSVEAPIVRPSDAVA